MTNKDAFQLSKDDTNMIKGIAIILMFFHHFLTYPNWNVSGYNYPISSGLANILRSPSYICVSIFSFITGYTYYLHNDKSLKYSFKKIISMMKNYWFALFLLLLFVKLLTPYTISINELVKEMTGIGKDIMIFCWYVPFYCLFMLIFPFFHKIFSKKKESFYILLFIFSSILLCDLTRNKYRNLYGLFNAFRVTFPVVLSGYYCAKNNILSFINYKISNKKLYIVLLLFSLFINILYTYFEYIYIITVPVFIFSSIKCVSNFHIRNMLISLGKQSTFMWFLHCSYFNTTNYLLQPIIYKSNNIFIVLFIPIITCYVFSYLYTLLQKNIFDMLKCKQQYFSNLKKGV